MAVRTRNTLKGWFKTLAKPLESQFWDWLDSFRHIDEKISSGDLAPDLLETINNLPSQETIDQLNESLQYKADLDLGTGKVVDSQIPDWLKSTEIVLETSGTIDIPAGQLVDILVFIPTAAVNIGIGSFAGGDDILMTQPFAANKPMPVAIYEYGAKTLYLTGITAQTTIKLFKRS